MIIPPYLKAGDEVIIIASARKISSEELAPAIEKLNNAGLTVILGKHIFEIENQFDGTDQQRTHDLQWALDHPTAKAIVFARGGYGTVRLINSIDFSQFKKNPKWIVGYSDITVLHNAILNIGISTMHATMAFSFSKNEESTTSLINTLLGIHKCISCEASIYNKNGIANAEIVGGNLSILYSIAGTPYDIDTTNKILFIEDLDEYLYHIDRMMMQLKLSGKLSNLKGIIIGGMSDMRDNTIPFGKTAEEIISEAVKEYNYPVCFNFPAGHIEKNLAIVFGKTALLNVEANQSTLSYL